MSPVLGKPAVHQCWANTDLYERQTCTGMTLVTQGWCELFLWRTSEPKSMSSVMGKPAVHQCWANADQYERHTCACLVAQCQTRHLEPAQKECQGRVART